MADGPWTEFQKKQPNADAPWTQFQKPAPSRASQIAKGVQEAEQRRQADVAEYQAMPGWQKPFQAAGDVATVMGNAPLMGYGEKGQAWLKSLVGPESYDEELTAARRQTESAKNRMGSPGTAAAAELAPLLALPTSVGQGANFLTRTGRGMLEGAGFGAAQAGGHDQDILKGAGVGAAQGAVGQLAGEATHGVSKLLDQGKQMLTDPTFRQELVKMARDAMIGGGIGYGLDQLTGYGDPVTSALLAQGRRALPGQGGVPDLPATQPSTGAPGLRDTLGKLIARIPIWGSQDDDRK